MTRYSKNREAILACLRGTDTHPTAEWIYEQLKPEYPNLSLGTLYRNLTQLKEAGLVRSMGVIAGLEHFDSVTVPHPHAACAKCGRVIDVKALPGMEEAMRKVKESSGFDIQGVLFTGICPSCGN